MRRTQSRSRTWIATLMAIAVLLTSVTLLVLYPLERGEAADSAEPAGTSPQQSSSTEDAEPPTRPDSLMTLSNAIGQTRINAEALFKQLNDQRIAKYSYFSVQDWTHSLPDTFKIPKSGEAIAYPASLLYEAGIKAGLEPIERYIGLALPVYVAPGFEADWTDGERDLILYNPYPFDIWMTAELSSGIPRLSLEARPVGEWDAPAISVERESFGPQRMVLLDHQTTADRIQAPGVDGLLARVYRMVDGHRELMYKDFYPPEPTVILTRPAEQIRSE